MLQTWLPCVCEQTLWSLQSTNPASLLSSSSKNHKFLFFNFLPWSSDPHSSVSVDHSLHPCASPCHPHACCVSHLLARILIYFLSSAFFCPFFSRPFTRQLTLPLPSSSSPSPTRHAATATPPCDCADRGGVSLQVVAPPTLLWEGRRAHRDAVTVLWREKGCVSVFHTYARACVFARACVCVHPSNVCQTSGVAGSLTDWLTHTDRMSVILTQKNHFVYVTWSNALFFLFFFFLSFF